MLNRLFQIRTAYIINSNYISTKKNFSQPKLYTTIYYFLPHLKRTTSWVAILQITGKSISK